MGMTPGNDPDSERRGRITSFGYIADCAYDVHVELGRQVPEAAVSTNITVLHVLPSELSPVAARRGPAPG